MGVPLWRRRGAGGRTVRGAVLALLLAMIGGAFAPVVTVPALALLGAERVTANLWLLRSDDGRTGGGLRVT
jgi:hypothetical protein